ncbi:MAG: substrate-binding domain-containing protein [Oleispira sp.]|nr:substrate-binding domain-containing protein [Oleispira sp.]
MINQLATFIVLVFFSLISFAENGHLFIVGSTSASPLIEASETAFSRYIGEDDAVNSSVVIRPIGSQKGLKSVIDQIADVGIISRYLNRTELDKWPYLKQVTIAQDALVFLVSKQNKITSLTAEQIKDIYTGSVTRWGDISQQNNQFFTQPIQPLSKGSAHGTFYAFHSLFELDYMIDPEDQGLYLKRRGESYLFSRRPTQTYSRFNQAMGIVNREPESTAYESNAVMQQYKDHLGFKKIKVLDIDNIAISEKSIRNQTYPWVRPLNLIINTHTKNEKVTQFVKFMLSEEGK